MSISSADRVNIGGFTLRKQAFVSMDFTNGSQIDDHEIAGIVGHDVVRRVITTNDYANHTLRFTRPSSFKVPVDAVALPLTFNDRTPLVNATVDGISGRFQVDTGATSTLSLMKPFVDAHQLVERYQPKLSRQVGGAGGTSNSLLTRAGELKLGPFSIKQPVTALLSRVAEGDIAGNIGGEILRRFTVTLDYDKQIMYLQPNASFASPMVFDRSGVRMKRDKDGTILIIKVEASAGDAVGLRSMTASLWSVAYPPTKCRWKPCVGCCVASRAAK